MPRLKLIAASAPSDPQARLPAFLRRRLLQIAEVLALPMAEIPIDEIASGFKGYENEFPPVLNLQQASKLAHINQSTLKRWVRERKFRGSVKTKKPMLFWRNRFVLELMAL